ncbi:MAG: hypothetical protein IT538_11710 [Variibacter sp.]|nr:hypothetical protein [Variibacter sp.]
MNLRRIDRGMVLSACIHAAVILWGAVSFAAKPLESKDTESIFVETLSMSDFSKIMAGNKQAEQKATPKPLVEKKAEPKPAENLSAPVSDKPEIVTASASQAEPPPPQAVPTPKPVHREARAEPAPQQPPEKPEPKKEPEKKEPDAEALKRAEKKEQKKEPKKQEARHAPQKKPEPKKQEPKKPPQQEHSNFSADQIQALLDKRQPRRLAAAGDVLNPTPALGAVRGSAPELSQNEIDALRARIQQCWNPPAGQADARELTVLVRIQFKPDGSLATEPRLISRVAPGYQQVAAESALRAIRRCAPYDFMPAAKYEAWKDIEVNFDPRDLFRG